MPPCLVFPTPFFDVAEADENGANAFENVEWEDNWDDEVEVENDFSKRLRAELEKNKTTT